MSEDWTWSEPSKEEFDRETKTRTFYRIYHFDGNTKVADYKFWGSGPEEALATLNRWKSSEKAVPGTEYFYSSAGYYVNPDGNRFDSFQEALEDYTNRKNLFEKFFNFLETFWWKTLGRIPDAWRWTKDFFRRGFLRHSISESWDLMFHILDDLEYNIPLMIRYTNSYPNGITYDEWKGILEDLLLHVRLYKYYENFGITDDKNREEILFGKRWESTIPRIEGTNGEIDYKKLGEMTQKEWDSIMDILRKWGQNLWD